MLCQAYFSFKPLVRTTILRHNNERNNRQGWLSVQVKNCVLSSFISMNLCH